MDGNRPHSYAKPGKTAGKCGFLLGGLVALLTAFPFLEDVASPLMLVIPLAGVFLAGVLVADSKPRHIRSAFMLAGLQVGFTVLSLIQRAEGASYKVSVSLALAATVSLILFSTWCVLGYVLRARVITRDQMYAGVCMYIMLGFAFGALFYLVNTLDPVSFVSNTQSPNEAPDLMYFSFVTLATLGYGDITPRAHLVRSLAILEALVGMLYIAVFMARLVSQHAGDMDRE